jgi:hypothetical protein
MRRSRSLLILAVATALAVALAVWVVLDRQARQTLAAPDDALFPGLVDRVNEVAKVEVVTPEASFAITRQDADKWVMPAKGDYPVRFETVKQAVVGMASLTPLEPRTADPKRYARLHVAAPTPDGESSGQGNLLRLIDKDGKAIGAVIVGKTKSVPTTGREGWYYVRKPDESQSWLAEGRIELFEKPTAWLDPAVPTVSRKRVHRVVSINQKGEEVVVERELPSTSDFKLMTVPEGRKPLHDAVGNSLGSSLGFLSFEDAGKAADVDFADGRKVLFHTFDGLTVTVDLVEREKDQWWARFSAKADPAASKVDSLPEAEREGMKTPEEVAQEAADINHWFGGWAYRMPEYKHKDFRADLDKVTVPKDGES